MSKYRNKYEIFCDAYGSYVTKAECKKCRLKRDCLKTRLPNLKGSWFRIPRYP